MIALDANGCLLCPACAAEAAWLLGPGDRLRAQVAARTGGPCDTCGRKIEPRNEDKKETTMDTKLLAVIEAEAEKEAETAIREGATSPWGDGETLQDVDDLRNVVPGLREMSAEDRREIAHTYDKAFRRAIDRDAPDKVVRA